LPVNTASSVSLGARQNSFSAKPSMLRRSDP
jgi:hypothetical protein